MTKIATHHPITLEHVEDAFAAWRTESDRSESTYRSRMDAYGAAVDLLYAYKAQERAR